MKRRFEVRGWRRQADRARASRRRAHGAHDRWYNYKLVACPHLTCAVGIFIDLDPINVDPVEWRRA